MTEVTTAISTISARVFGKEPNKMVYELFSLWVTNIDGSSLLRLSDLRAI
jgi:lysyl-tRNA synthetase class I